MITPKQIAEVLRWVVALNSRWMLCRGNWAQRPDWKRNRYVACDMFDERVTDWCPSAAVIVTCERMGYGTTDAPDACLGAVLDAMDLNFPAVRTLRTETRTPEDAIAIFLDDDHPTMPISDFLVYLDRAAERLDPTPREVINRRAAERVEGDRRWEAA